MSRVLNQELMVCGERRERGFNGGGWTQHKPTISVSSPRYSVVPGVLGIQYYLEYQVIQQFRSTIHTEYLECPEYSSTWTTRYTVLPGVLGIQYYLEYQVSQQFLQYRALNSIWSTMYTVVPGMPDIQQYLEYQVYSCTWSTRYTVVPGVPGIQYYLEYQVFSSSYSTMFKVVPGEIDIQKYLQFWIRQIISFFAFPDLMRNNVAR